MNKQLISIIKSIPVLGTESKKILLSFNKAKIKRKTKNRIKLLKRRSHIAKKYNLIDPFDIPVFLARGAGPDAVITKLTILSINKTVPLLNELYKELHGANSTKTYSIEEFCSVLGNDISKKSTGELGKIFKKYGSDKSSIHDYHLIYEKVLKNKDEITGILEIGMGTNNTALASNMGKSGRPGASLRAFKDYLPNAMIYGADLDKNILFEEERIKTFFVDQTKEETLELLGSQIPTDLDLIIDDGLHSPNANIATFIFALKKMKNRKGGYIIIEDIPASSISIWKMISHIIPNNLYTTYLIKTKAAYMFVVQIV